MAVGELVRLTQPAVWQVCASLGSAGEVEDLVQETYLRALGSLARYRADAPVRVWLLAIARRVCADHVRRRQRHRRLVDRITGSTTALDVPAPEVVDDLLEVLDADRREAFVLTQLVGPQLRGGRRGRRLPDRHDPVARRSRPRRPARRRPARRRPLSRVPCSGAAAPDVQGRGDGTGDEHGDDDGDDPARARAAVAALGGRRGRDRGRDWSSPVSSPAWSPSTVVVGAAVVGAAVVGGAVVVGATVVVGAAGVAGVASSSGAAPSARATSSSRPGASAGTSSSVTAGSDPAARTSTCGAGYSSPGAVPIQASSSPFSHRCTAGNASSVPTASGTVSSTGNDPCSSDGRTPPVHSSTVLPVPSGVAVAFHPSTAPAVASATGAWIRTPTVGDSPHPCSGWNDTVASDPAGTATALASVWAASGDEGSSAIAHPAAAAIAAVHRRRRCALCSWFVTPPVSSRPPVRFPRHRRAASAPCSCWRRWTASWARAA